MLEKVTKCSLTNHRPCKDRIKTNVDNFKKLSNDYHPLVDYEENTSFYSISDICEINPAQEKIIGFIWVGYGERTGEIKRPKIQKIFRKMKRWMN